MAVCQAYGSSRRRAFVGFLDLRLHNPMAQNLRAPWQGRPRDLVPIIPLALFGPCLPLCFGDCAAHPSLSK